MLRLASLIAVLFVCASVHAERSLLSGSLGLWLDRSVAPEFVDKLANHPKFKNTTLKFVTLENGQPAMENALTRAIQKELMHHVLKAGNNNVSWRDGGNGCGVQPKHEYVVGVEVARRGASQYRLDLAVLDPRERVWVGGLSFSWEGRLLTSEKRALGRAVSSGALGSMSNPVAISDSTALNRIVSAQFDCTLRGGLEGSVYVASDTERSLTPFVGELRRVMAVRPGIVLTDRPDSAAWQVDAQVVSVGRQLHELAVSVVPTDSDVSAQRVVSIFVTGVTGVESGRFARSYETKRAAAVGAPLLAHLELVSTKPDLTCGKSINARRAGAGQCAELVLEVSAQAHVFVFGTSGGSVNAPSCEGRLREPGEYRFRIKIDDVEPVERRPQAGFYVVASRDGSVISKIGSRVGRLAGACSGNRSSFARLTKLVAELDADIEWKAIHVRLERDSLVEI